MDVVVSGATGFVGDALCRALVQRGDRVRALSRRPEAAERRPAIYRAFKWDPASPSPQAEAFEGAGAVVNLAGESVFGLWTAAKKDRIRRSRVEGTLRLVRAMAEAADRPRVLVSASAIGYYGDRGEQSLSESAGPGVDFLAESCLAWEQAALEAEKLGVRVALLRIGLVLDSGGGALRQMLPPARLGLGGPLGSGRQWWSWIHRSDLVRMMLTALDDESWKGPANAVSPGVVRQRDFARALGAVLRRPAFLPAPAFVLKTLLDGFAVELLASRKVTPEAPLERGFQFEYAQLKPALETILR